MKDALFHLAFPTHDVAAAKHFYVDGLGCTLGRESSHAVMFGLAGHQLVAHLTTKSLPQQQGIYPHHFGLTFLSKESWQQFLERAQEKKLPFYQQPRVRFPGTRIEHHTFFLEDPPTICSNLSTTRMSRRSLASEIIVRSATRCSFPPALGLGSTEYWSGSGSGSVSKSGSDFGACSSWGIGEISE